jgi:branched-chain amino acid aminotransferase
MELAKEMGKKVQEINLTRYDLFVADEVFLTGTGAEIAPVAELDGRTIGSVRPGPITLELMKRFKNLTQTSGVPIFN